MQFRYDEDFIEAAVFACATGRRAGIPSLQIARFHAEREKLYSILDPDERNTGFFHLHVGWFREWGLEKVLLDLLAELPSLSGKLALLALRRTQGKTDEGAELYVNQAGQRTAIVALRPAFFAQGTAIRDYLRHEFMHLNDMVNPAFGYSPTLDLPGLNSAQQRLARERYRLLWDITIDGRLAARGHPPMQNQEQHVAAFDRGYAFWTEEKRSSVFASLWKSRSPSHAELLSLIDDPRGLRHSLRPAAGASCPLCDFPTFAWAPDDRVSQDILRRIQLEFPQWQADQGLCNRCLETYEATASAAVTSNA